MQYVVMHVMHDVMMHHVAPAALGLHRDCFRAVGSGLSVGGGLLGAGRGRLSGSGRLLGRVRGALSALRRRRSLLRRGLRLLGGVLPGAACSKQRKRQSSPGESG